MTRRINSKLASIWTRRDQLHTQDVADWMSNNTMRDQSLEVKVQVQTVYPSLTIL